MSSSDIRRRETVTQPYYAAIESVADPNTRRVLRDIYDHLPLDYVTRDDLPDVTQVVRETVVVPQFVDRGFVDRGDPAAPDWTHADLTCDGDWHVLDLTTVNAAIAGATEVQLRLVFTSQSGHVKFRRHGCVNEVNVEERYYYYTYLQKYTTIHVAPDENGRIDYWAASGTHFDLTVSGWWTGYGSEGTGSSSEIALNSAHRLGDGSDHADVAANTAHRLGDGSDHADVADNTAHRLGDGTDHSAIATAHPHQGVAAGDSPTFAGLTLSGASGVLLASGGVVTGGATTTNLPEGTNLYFTEERVNAASNVVAAYNHITSSGASHSYIATAHPHQGVAAGDSPTFAGLTLSGASGVLLASGGVVTGGATTTNLPEGTNLYFTEERVNAASNVVAAYNHITSDGSDHADVAANTAHRTGDGTDHSAIATGHPHQSVSTSSSPSFAGLSVACASEPIANFRGTDSSTTTHRIYITNSLDAYTANRAAISFRCNSSTQMRAAAEIAAGLSTVIDASRVGILELRTADAGTWPTTRMAIRGSQIGFFGVTPVSRDTGWSVTNVTTDRSYDADATTVDELADVLGTLIKYLISLGLLGA